MPRSKRRKGVKRGQTLREQSGTIAANRLPSRHYYDPGKRPMPRNLAKDAKRAKRAVPRHDHRRGS